MNRLLSLFLILCLVLCAFSACADKEEKGNESKPTESKPAENKPTESNPTESKPVINTEFCGAWTYGDDKSTATYIFEEGGVGYLVSYTARRVVTNIKWETAGPDLCITLLSPAGESQYVNYVYKFTEAGLELSYNGAPLTYVSGPWKDAPLTKCEEGAEKDSVLVGDWVSTLDDGSLKITYNADGTGIYTEGSTVYDAYWCTEDGEIKYSLRKYGVELETVSHEYSLKDGILTLFRYESQYTTLKKVGGGEEKPAESHPAESEPTESETEQPDNYPTNGGDDNMAGSWKGEGFVMELEADGTGRYLEGERAYDAFWGIKEGQFYFTYLVEDKASTTVYDYIADGGKLYLTDDTGAETVLTAE